VFETDPVKLYQFGKIRRDMKKSAKALEEAVEKGNLNSRYNLGVIHLDESL
jgi:TPR repeat protein